MPRILQKRLTLFLLRTVTSSPVKRKRLRQKRKRRLIVPKAQNHKQATVLQRTRQAYRKVPPKQESTEPAFDISYWISFAKSYAESVGLTLNSEAVYCWDNPIDADAGCIYLERDIQSRLNRYAADADITDVWVWYESVSAGSYLIYIGYA